MLCVLLANTACCGLLPMRQSAIGESFMEKTTSALLGALVLVVAGVVIWGGRPRASAGVVVPSTGLASLSASTSASASASAYGFGAGVGVGDSARGAGQPLGFGADTKAGFVLLDGSTPSPLPPDAPKYARFGVVLIQYRGAERAPITARSKAEALELAKSLTELAKEDFAAAVEKGDAGSTVSAGLMPQRVLEPAPEYVLFTTPPGEVGGPVDTPTGYWIIKNTAKPK